MKNNAPTDPLAVRTCYLRNLLTDAWDLARDGAGTFGGSPHAYLPLSLRTELMPVWWTPRLGCFTRLEGTDGAVGWQQIAKILGQVLID